MGDLIRLPVRLRPVVESLPQLPAREAPQPEPSNVRWLPVIPTGPWGGAAA